MLHRTHQFINTPGKHWQHVRCCIYPEACLGPSPREIGEDHHYLRWGGHRQMRNWCNWHSPRVLRAASLASAAEQRIYTSSESPWMRRDGETGREIAVDHGGSVSNERVGNCARQWCYWPSWERVHCEYIHRHRTLKIPRVDFLPR